MTGIPLRRRTVLKGAIAASAAGFGTAAFGGQAIAQEGESFLVEQGDNCFDVTPLTTGETVEDFYGYSIDGEPHSHTSTGIEQSDVSNLFLFEGSEGRSLVVQHDEPNDEHGTDSGGGAVSFDITGLTAGGWVVEDDGGEPPDWAWAERHTDGGAWRGGLDCDFSVTIDPAFNEDAIRDPLNPGTIDEWHFLSGDANNPDRITLDMDEPVTIRCGACLIEVDIDIKPGSDPNAINPDSKGVIPVAILHTDDFDPATIDVSTVRFGDPEDVDAGGGAAPAHDGHFEDVDGDGDDDLVLHFPTPDAGFDGDESEGKLVGKTNDGTPVAGTDSVELVGGGNGGGGGP